MHVKYNVRRVIWRIAPYDFFIRPKHRNQHTVVARICTWKNKYRKYSYEKTGINWLLSNYIDLSEFNGNYTPWVLKYPILKVGLIHMLCTINEHSNEKGIWTPERIMFSVNLIDLRIVTTNLLDYCMSQKSLIVSRKSFKVSYNCYWCICLSASF